MTQTHRPTERPQPRKGSPNGTLRAYKGIIVLALHYAGAKGIGDAGGTAGRSILTKSQIDMSTTPQGLSNALHTLRSEGFIDADIDGSRSYSYWLTGRLTQASLAGFLREEPWARAFVLNQRPLPEVTWSPPEIEFENPRELTAHAVDAIDGTATRFEVSESSVVGGTSASVAEPAYQVPSSPSPRTSLTEDDVAELRDYLDSLEMAVAKIRGILKGQPGFTA